MRAYHFLLWLFLGSNSLLLAQFERQLHFTNFGKKDGLIDPLIFCGVQDDLGYLWFGSGTGLYQYDGKSFIKYESPIRTHDFLLENILQCVSKDASGNLWLGSLNALQWFNPRTRQFSSHSLKDSVFRKMCQSSIKHIVFDSLGDAWICTYNKSFYHFRKKDSSFHFVSNKFDLDTKKFLIASYSYAKNEMYVLTVDGIYHLDLLQSNSRFIPFPNQNRATNSYRYNDILYITLEPDCVLEFDMSSKKFILYPWTKDYIKEYTPLCALKSNKKLVLGGYGIRFLDVENNSSQHATMSHLNEFDLHINKIVYMFEDHEGNLWLCSHFGLSMLSWQNSQVLSSPIQNNKKLSIEPAMVCALNKNQWFIGSSYGSSIENKSLLIDENLGKQISIKKSKNHQKSNYVYFKCRDKVFASDDLAFYLFIEQENLLQDIHITDQHGRIPKDIYKVVYQNNGNVILVSYKNGFYDWDGNNSVMHHFNRWDVDGIKSDSLDNDIIPFLSDSQGKIWTLSNKGIFKYDLISKQGIQRAASLLPNIQINSYNIGAHQSTDGHIWISSTHEGIFEYWEEKEKEFLNKYNQHSNNGIPSNSTYDLLKDPLSNHLWVFNLLGILKFDLDKKKVIGIIDKQRGLSEDVYGYYKQLNEEGKLLMTYFGKADLVPLSNFLWDSIAPRLCFNSIKITGKEFIKEWGTHKHHIQIPYNKNYVEIEWAALHYNNPNRIEYLYQLSGKDTQWVSLKNKNNIALGGLSEGNHTLKIQAINCDGIESNEFLELHMKVSAPFWRQAWFAGLVVLGMLIGFSILYRYRTNQIKRESGLKMQFAEQLSNIELRALRAQMNPHFIFNCLNSIQKYILKNDQFNASQYLTKFSRLIRLILDQSNQNYILLSSELELLQLYVEMEQLRFDNSFQYLVRVEETVDPMTIEIPSLLIQPYIENAIWHGLLHKEENGKIELSLSKSNGHLTVIVEDNGIGREKAKEFKSKQVLKNKSYGMKITEDRISIFNTLYNQQASHKVEDLRTGSESSGTRVTITIPYRFINENA